MVYIYSIIYSVVYVYIHIIHILSSLISFGKSLVFSADLETWDPWSPGTLLLQSGTAGEAAGAASHLGGFMLSPLGGVIQDIAGLYIYCTNIIKYIYIYVYYIYMYIIYICILYICTTLHTHIYIYIHIEDNQPCMNASPSTSLNVICKHPSGSLNRLS